ncbi:MAG: imidazole glycerol phosphate synthase subunit HisH [Clostridia bacterium]|nr:imidazole glycerol phosphate synthase subunit HisH [Clostridia bacterium]
MTVIIDYGVGNLFSLISSFEAIGAEVTVSASPDMIRKADRLILPGVGAFRDAREKLMLSGLDKTIIEEVGKGKPLLGICLGMQMLFDKSYEYGEYEGLGLLRGEVRPIAEVIDPALKIPHIGWNALHFTRPSPLFRYLNEGDYVYFVHSYYACGCEDSLIATADYSHPLTAAVSHGSVYGCQFHPEKSGEVGLKILRAFLEIDPVKDTERSTVC